MCDKIKEGDERYYSMKEIIDLRGCGTAHNVLDLCLTKYDKDWRKCQKEVADLGKCLSTVFKEESLK
jgi:hypothetical protein